jgi:hypothetical protein
MAFDMHLDIYYVWIHRKWSVSSLEKPKQIEIWDRGSTAQSELHNCLKKLFFII